MRMSRRLGQYGNRLKGFVYTYSGTSTFSGDPLGDWVLTLKTAGNLVITSLPTNVDVFLVGGGGNGGANSSWHDNQWGTGTNYTGGAGGYGAQTTTAKNLAVAKGTHTVKIGAAGGVTSAFGKSASGSKRAGGAGAGTKSGGAGTNGEYAFGESAFAHALGAGYRFSASGGGGAGGVPATSEYGTAGKGGTSGGGAGGNYGKNGGAATANSGSGGGGAGGNAGKPGAGGSGIIIIRNAR